MRLQVSVRRHNLPAINIIFTTGSGPSSRTLSRNSTIADLLQDVNDLVPLESESGEWGLEDYVVEVQATADQETYYECLHYQTIDGVLREDDEVIIRSLATEDLRRARLGGRHQISADGRHLIDGVAFGREWLKRGARPEIIIPRRKRRRTGILAGDEDLDEESTTLLQQIQELGHLNEDSEDDEDEDDEDFIEGEGSDEEDQVSSEDEADRPLRIKATAEFEDADIDEDDAESDEEEQQEDDNSDDEIMAGTGLELSDELRALLREAEELSENGNYQRLSSEVAQSPHKGKRKRQDEEEEIDDASDFEGFSTPTKSAVAIELLDSPVTSASASDASTTSSNSDLDSDSDEELHKHNDEEVANDTSSSGSSSSEQSDSETDTSGANSPSSDSSTDLSDEEDTTLKESNLLSSSPAKKSSSGRSADQSSSSGSISTSEERHVIGMPFQGSKRTKIANIRNHKRKRLRRLKADGLLPPDANFADLAALDKQTQIQETVDGETQLEIEASIEFKKKTLLSQIHSSDEMETDVLNEHDQPTEAESVAVVTHLAQHRLKPVINAEPRIDEEIIDTKTIAVEQTKATEANGQVPSREVDDGAQESLTGTTTPKSTKRRAKLDLASSRRMLFNSLGLRNPRTQAAEEALREKLNSSANSTPQRQVEDNFARKSQNMPVEEADMNSWKDRIVLSAVECESEGVKLSTPSFPFKQGWDSNANMRRGASKKNGRQQSNYHDEEEDGSYVSQSTPNVHTLQVKESRSEGDDRPESRTLSLEEQGSDEFPRPVDFGALLRLGTADLDPGAVIAFKELDIQNFQPVISEYRIARVRDMQLEGTDEIIELMLSKQDWPSGRGGSDPFAIEDEDSKPEDGVRFKRFADLIEPKLVNAPSVQVTATPAEISSKILKEDVSASLPPVQSSVVPESEQITQTSNNMAPPENKNLKMTHVEVNAPRHNEITAISKESSFESAPNNDLLQQNLQPESVPHSSPAFHTRSHHSQRSSRSPVPAETHTRTANVTQPELGSRGMNGWESNSLRPVVGDSSLLAPAQTSRQSSPSDPLNQPTVNYSALSQLELDASGVTVTNDSSFQDAQRVSQLPALDASNPQRDLNTSKSHPDYPFDGFGAEDSILDLGQTQKSLASEVPQSPPSQPVEVGSGKPSISFLDPGLDGQASSDEGSDFNSENSSLHSLRELTSSQNRKIKRSARRSRASLPVTRSAKTSISPPPKGRASRLRNGQKRSASPEPSESDDGVDLPPIKASQSQEPRMSQLPAGSQIVDLTCSSDPFVPESDEEYQAPRTRASKGRINTKMTMQGSFSSGSGSGSHEEDGEGAAIGKRRFLTTKKWRSHV